MKVPLSWLHEFVTPAHEGDELLEFLGRNGLEIEEVTTPGAGTSGVHTVKVLSWEPHPDADKLRVVTVDNGTGEVTLVCGASNFDVGDVALHAPPGATLPGGFELSTREIRGVPSPGMLCSAKELELAGDAAGIITLPGDTPLGVDAHEVFPLGEPVIEIAVLSDRGDQHSILGIAREYAALIGAELRVPGPALPEATGGVPVVIEATAGCANFVTWAIEGVTVGPSPLWMQRRLEQCGVRAINSVVDVTNYVMLELGQPLHAFDLDTLHGPELTVRWAREGETLVTLDDQERELLPTDMVITDADRIVSLAAVMGGAETEVSATTTRVLVEGAIWDPKTVRRTSRRLNLISEASLRYERRVDPLGARRAVARAIELLQEITGGTPGLASEAGEAVSDHREVLLDPTWTPRFLGVEDLGDQAAALRRLGCTVEERGDLLAVTPPSWRGDLARPADLAEEIARLHGYDHIPSTVPAIAQRGGLTVVQRAERDVREAARAHGFDEAVTRPFVGDEAMVPLHEEDGRVRPMNPLAADASALRPSIVEGLLGVVRHNVGQGRPGVAVYEIGRIFRPAGGALDEVLDAFGKRWRWGDRHDNALPTQPITIGLAAQGVRVGDGWVATDDRWDVYDVLAVLDEIVRRLDGTRTLERRAVERDGLHPTRTAALYLDGEEVGIVGQLHPRESDRRDIPDPVVVGELLLEPLFEALGEPDRDLDRAPELVRHAAMGIDVAVVADRDLPYADIERAIRAGAGDLLDDLWWFDEYAGEQVGEGRRSVAVRLRLQAPDRQLTDADAEKVISDVGRTVEAIGASLRR